MEIRSLRYAVTLAEELHFGRAAQRHFIAAQPFGRHIQRLEREVGRRLFERTSRRVVLTSAGERLIAEARRVLAAVDALAEVARSGPLRDRGSAGPLRDREPAEPPRDADRGPDVPAGRVVAGGS
ncbi:LysR family transcriptional regulator [Nonomuraea sp. NPDC049709]|uniref:LysR family transcriptional regulator n=1 Tax=Nonomuraea sp. NPDC049709 TaxID=3154736 RepID=UPI00341FC55F